MARKKSYYDIRNQANRIKKALAQRNGVGNMTSADLNRYMRVNEIAGTYLGKIASTKSFDKAERKETAREYVRGVSKAASRKYSPKTYMGMSNG